MSDGFDSDWSDDSVVDVTPEQQQVGLAMPLRQVFLPTPGLRIVHQVRFIIVQVGCVLS